jgi:hypothetical protein
MYGTSHATSRPIYGEATVACLGCEPNVPYIDTLALKKEQLRLYKEQENLSNDLAINKLYSNVAANPGALR